MQAKLLEALQNQEVQRLGSLTPRKVNVRVVAATHNDLRQQMVDKQFREDLYYRLAMVELRVPALREHMEDLPLLTHHFLDKYSRQFDRSVRQVDPASPADTGQPRCSIRGLATFGNSRTSSATPA